MAVSSSIDGKFIGLFRMSLRADGKTMEVRSSMDDKFFGLYLVIFRMSLPTRMVGHSNFDDDNFDLLRTPLNAWKSGHNSKEGDNFGFLRMSLLAWIGGHSSMRMTTRPYPNFTARMYVDTAA